MTTRQWNRLERGERPKDFQHRLAAVEMALQVLKADFDRLVAARSR